MYVTYVNLLSTKVNIKSNGLVIFLLAHGFSLNVSIFLKKF